jgi:hypothetical protein
MARRYCSPADRLEEHLAEVFRITSLWAILCGILPLIYELGGHRQVRKRHDRSEPPIRRN